MQYSKTFPAGAFSVNCHSSANVKFNMIFENFACGAISSQMSLFSKCKIKCNIKIVTMRGYFKLIITIQQMQNSMRYSKNFAAELFPINGHCSTNANNAIFKNFCTGYFQSIVTVLQMRISM